MTYITHHDRFTERDEQAAEREREAVLRERFQPCDIDDQRRDIPHGHAHRLRYFASTLIAQKKLWLARAVGDGDPKDQLFDTEQLGGFAREAAELIEPLIQRVLAAADEHERKAA